LPGCLIHEILLRSSIASAEWELIIALLLSHHELVEYYFDEVTPSDLFLPLLWKNDRNCLASLEVLPAA
jgi:hypothetical protein